MYQQLTRNNIHITNMYSNHINHNGHIHIISMYNNHINLIMVQEALMAQEVFPLVGVAVLAVREDLEMVDITAQAVADMEAILEVLADVSPEAQVELLTAPVPPRDRVEEWAGTPPKAPSAWTPTSSCLKRRSQRSQSLSTMARSME